MIKCEHAWYQIEDGVKLSPLHFGLTQIMDYINSHDFSPAAVIYRGHLERPKYTKHKSEKMFVSDEGWFLQDFLTGGCNG